MKKIFFSLILTIFVITSAYAISSKFVIPNENDIKYFEAENWWLRKYKDIKFGSSFFYSPLEKDQLFSGVYYRFNGKKLEMFDLHANRGVAYNKLYAYIKSLGSIRKFGQTPYAVCSKVFYIKDEKGKKIKAQMEMAILLVKKDKTYRVIYTPRETLKKENYQGSLLKAHLEACYVKKN